MWVVAEGHVSRSVYNLVSSRKIDRSVFRKERLSILDALMNKRILCHPSRPGWSPRPVHLAILKVPLLSGKHFEQPPGALERSVQLSFWIRNGMQSPAWGRLLAQLNGQHVWVNLRSLEGRLPSHPLEA